MYVMKFLKGIPKSPMVDTGLKGLAPSSQGLAVTCEVSGGVVVVEGVKRVLVV